MTRRTNDFQTIRSEGGLLPPDLLRRVLDPKEKLEGARPEDYGLPQGERLNEVITQSWSRLRKHWAEFRSAAEKLPKDEPGTGLTNDKWSLPLLRELGFGLLPTSAGPEVNGRSYAINRFFGPVPIHLVGCGLSLDRRAAGVRGAAALNPHGLVQDFLNRSPGHLWAIVSNGLRLRVLRDSQTLSRQSFLEFDLESMCDGEVYSDFVLLWLMAHATRFAPREGERPDTCWLELWTKEAEEQGARVLGDLRGGVERAIQVLGEGFTSHPRNTALRDALRTGQVTPTNFHGQLLRIVYRLIFLFVAEDRTIDGIPLLHPRDRSDSARIARERYSGHYSTGRLRELAGKIKGSRHGDLWRQFQFLVGALSGQEKYAALRQALALPALGSFLWDPAFTAALNDAELTNHDLLESLRHLAFTRQGKMLRPVDYRNLGAEELGGVYESLLALTPQISSDGLKFTFAEFAGNERKTSGSYYTPDSLVQCLLDSALDPVVEEAIKGKTGVEAEKVILALKVCDPAVGSGHFLVGAAHRLARHLARVRALAQGESEPSPLLYQHALRDVIGRCLYGVDMNPMAAELCRVSLWLEALEPGKPLSFLDHHIRVGNSLLGATPELIAAGLPDGAFEPSEGDDKAACSSLKQLNRAQREGLRHLFIAEDTAIRERIYQVAASIDEMSDNRPEDIRRKEAAFIEAQKNDDFQKAWDLANLWCAAFIIKKRFLGEANVSASPEPSTLNSQPAADQAGLYSDTEDFPKPKAKRSRTLTPRILHIASPWGITTQHLRDFVEGAALPEGLLAEVKRLADQSQFFHFHLAFPEVFSQGGFDVSLGNPPWERTALEELEFFARSCPEVLDAPTTAIRKQVIQSLRLSMPQLFEEYSQQKRKADGEGRFFNASGLYPLGAQGRLNTYALFANLGLRLLCPKGRLGMILQSGLASDAPMEDFWRFLVRNRLLVVFIDFENKKRIFQDVHPEQKFALVSFTGSPQQNGSPMTVGFWLQEIEELKDATKVYELEIEDLERFSPNTGQPLLTRRRSDVDVLRRIYSASDVCWNTGLARGRAKAWVAMTSASFSDFCRRETDIPGASQGNNWELALDNLIYSPLLEAKLIEQYDFCFATYEGISQKGLAAGDPREIIHADGALVSLPKPRFWANKEVVDEFFKSKNGTRGWCLAYRDVTNVNNERTAIATVLPSIGFLQPLNGISCSDARTAAMVIASINSFACDFVARLRFTGRHLNVTTFSQLPIPKWMDASFVVPRVVELVYVGDCLKSFANECGYEGGPHVWNDNRRFQLKCELDAAFSHFYGLTAEDLGYIFETFNVLRSREEKAYGKFRTRDTVLEYFENLTETLKDAQD